MPVAAVQQPRKAIVDPTQILLTAEGLRRASGQKAFPLSVKGMIEAAYPDIVVTGAKLPLAVMEMATVDANGRRTIIYNRNVNTAAQRVAIVHGLAHLLFDSTPEKLECGRSYEAATTEAIERRADLFAAELLAPLPELQRRVPGELFPRGASARQAFDDHVDSVASTLKVPPGFIRWRLYDLMWVRKTSWVVG